MSKAIPNRIHIIGSVGSGKTTLARSLSKKLNIPFYELDNVVWIRTKSGDVQRGQKERDKYLTDIVRSEAWIIEGVHHPWVSPSWEKADLIIFLDTDYSIRTYRIIKRYIRQKLGREKANYQPSFDMFKKMFGWNAYFEKKSKPEIMELLRPYEEKLLILKDNRRNILNEGS
ncbi:AAA family ATPase [Heyndrickxia sporothermodurans]|uniref:AAA family ATPase n=1 Tax=Heyndrickxia TaxID=2837504 RepID=UPI001FD594C6|nr:AAA family ATPase [Heyndrickxia sporothermodurans]MEB6551329.1 AAA family ATPase [Heyndrickxia sporothermodurans]MED3697714.1 AAA family ATPase [Heyndrickxia sporothermodurans]MED3780010.1 AAA family ATPase [Heyndrickxia sporothermodurans]